MTNNAKPSPRTRTVGRRRSRRVASLLGHEALEARTLLTSMLYLDYGDMFPGGVLQGPGVTVGSLLSHTAPGGTNINGPELTDNTGAKFAASTPVQLTSFNTIYGATAASMRATMNEIVRRIYAPFDVQVVDLTSDTLMIGGHGVRAATSLDDVSRTLAANNSESKSHDSYVFITQGLIGGTIDDTTTNPTRFPNHRYGGIASGLDIGKTNKEEGTALVLLRGTDFGQNWLGDTIAHEAGHLFGFQHAYRQDTENSPPASLGAAGEQLDLYHRSEAMSYLAYDGFQVFSRVPTVDGDGNVDPNKLSAPPTPYDHLKADDNVGISNIEYVTGSGANDIITITRTGLTTGTVTVQPFFKNDYTVPITIPGTTSTAYSYLIDLTKPLVIDAGANNDRVVLDGDLGTTITVQAGMGADSLVVHGKGAGSATYTPGTNTALGIDGNSDQRGTIHIGTTVIKFQELDGTSTVTMDGVSDVQVVGSNASDYFALTTPMFGQTQLSGWASGASIVPLVFSAAALEIEGRDGDDSLWIDVGSASSVDLIGVPITFLGGVGADSLNVSGTPASPVTDVTYTVGPANGQGRLDYRSLSGFGMTIDFLDLEPIIDTVPAAILTVVGTAADNAISYTQGVLATWGKVTVDAHESIEFSDKGNLVLKAGSGRDEISLNNPSLPTGLTAVTVEGSDPTASDHLIVNGVAGAFDVIDHTPTAVGAGSVSVLGLPVVTYSDIEHLTINGQGGGDLLRLTTPAGPDTVKFTPGTAFDAGTLRFPSSPGYVRTSFLGLDLTGSIRLLDAGGAADTLVYSGTDASEAIFVDTPNNQIIRTALGRPSNLPVFLDGIGSMSIEGGAGQNALSVSGSPMLGDHVVVAPVGTRLRYALDNFSLASFEAADIQELNVTLGGGADTIDVLDMTGTSLRVTTIDVGAGDAVQDLVTVEGRNTRDEITIGMDAGAVTLDGTSTRMRVTSGTAADDVLQVRGNHGADLIEAAEGTSALIGLQLEGNGGNDTITGDATILGGAGDDTLTGGASDNLILGGAGNDQIFGVEGNDTLLGDASATGVGATFAIVAASSGQGNDTLDGGLGNDTINGDVGDDVLSGGGGNDVMGVVVVGAITFADPGNDTMRGGAGDDTINGGDGSDLVAGNAGTDSLLGSAGDDTVLGGAGEDSILGGDGDDLLLGDADSLVGSTIIAIASGQGNDTLDGGLGNDTINGDVGDDVLSGGGGNDVMGVVVVGAITFADPGNDTMRGGAGDDTINGGAGNDQLFGDSGNDTVGGGDGLDVIFGGLGNDSIAGNAGADTVDGGDGNDTVSGGDGNDTITGADGNDALAGDAGDDVVLGQVGDDVIDGGAGNDQLWGGVGTDRVNGGDGDDLVLGNDGNDVLSGGNGGDIVLGQAGDDTIRGGFGNDFVYGGDGNDLIYGGDGSPANVAHRITPPSPSDGDDVLSGGAGTDTLDGGNGNNILDAGDDRIREVALAGSGNDIAYAHCVNQDGTSDRFGLDGGVNRVYVSGGLVDPTAPAESTSRVSVTVVVPRPQGPFVYQPGDPEKRHLDPVNRHFQNPLPRTVTINKAAAKFAARHKLVSNFPGRK